MQREVGAWWCIRKKTYSADPFQKVLENEERLSGAGIKNVHVSITWEKKASLSLLLSVSKGRQPVAVLSRCWCPRSICKYCYSSPSPSPHPMWVREILEWHMNCHFSPLEKCKEKKKKKPTTPHPFRGAQAICPNGYKASLKAKRTPDVWEGSPTLKWITLKQNILSQIGLCLNSLLLLGEGKRGRLLPLGLLRTPTASFGRLRYKQPHTHWWLCFRLNSQNTELNTIEPLFWLCTTSVPPKTGGK